jgi:hypothetical protein
MLKPAAALSSALLLFVLSTFAQAKLPFTNNELRTNLQKVISDFPRQMSTIKGETMAENPQTIEFATLLKFESVEDNSITQYNSKKPIYSWQATFLTTEDYEAAVKKYKWLCGQLKAMTLNLDGGYSFTLYGDYEAPSEARKFTTTVYHMTPAASNLPKLNIEVGMQFLFPEWKITLTVYQKEREDAERGQKHDD